MAVIYVRRTSIIPLLNVALARDLALNLGTGTSGAKMWTAELSPLGTAPATHYISNGVMQDTNAALWPLDSIDALGVKTRISAGNATQIYNSAIAKGMVVLLADIQALLAAADVTDRDSPFAEIARLGLQPVKGALP